MKSAVGGMGMPGMNHGGSDAAGGKPTPQVDHPQHEAKPARKILYWYEPMHPCYRSYKPGKAPDCGMDIVPQSADEKKEQ